MTLWQWLCHYEKKKPSQIVEEETFENLKKTGGWAPIEYDSQAIPMLALDKETFLRTNRILPHKIMIQNQRSLHVLKGFYTQTLVKYDKEYQDSKKISALFIPWRNREQMKRNASNFEKIKKENKEWSKKVQFILNHGYLFYQTKFSALEQNAYEEYLIEEDEVENEEDGEEDEEDD
jgi:hypothetical protein